MANILKYPEGKEIILGDGKTYKLSPFNLNVMLAIEEEFDCNFSEFGNLLVMGKVKEADALRKLLKILLTEKHPELSLSEIGGLITLDNINEANDAVGTALFGEKYTDFKMEAMKSTGTKIKKS